VRIIDAHSGDTLAKISRHCSVGKKREREREFSIEHATAVYTRRARLRRDSDSQNVRILKQDKHSEITIRATLVLAPPANRGVFNRA